MMPNKKACRFFFGPSRKCNKGESCEYSHDPASQHSFSSGGPRGDFNANRLGGQGFHSKDYHPNNYSNNNQGGGGKRWTPRPDFKRNQNQIIKTNRKILEEEWEEIINNISGKSYQNPKGPRSFCKFFRQGTCG